MSSIAKHLLDNISSIIKSYEKVAAITGENFNIFSILKMDANEVRLHSALLGELLNPKGSHAQKDIFLKLFLVEINITDFDTENAKVDIEKHIGAVSDDYDNGGRIDLIINSSNNRSIIIENKIYAGDGHKQLYRYYNYDKNAILYYLTLEGDAPSPNSLSGLNINKVNLISYRFHIINWLEDCKKQAVEFPLLRETITQYIYLLKRLTNQSINHEMEENIVEKILETEDTFKSAISIKDSINSFEKTINTRCFEELKLAWGAKFGADWDVEFFKYNTFMFFIRPNDELGRFHFQLFPLNSQTNKMGVANDSEIPPEFREIAESFFHDSSSNENYTIWGYSKFELNQLTFEEYKELYYNRDKWVDKVINEGVCFMIDFIKQLKSEEEYNIEINPFLEKILNI